MVRDRVPMLGKSVTVNVGSGKEPEQVAAITAALENLRTDFTTGLEEIRRQLEMQGFTLRGIAEREAKYIDELLKLDRQLGRTRGRRRRGGLDEILDIAG